MTWCFDAVLLHVLCIRAHGRDIAAGITQNTFKPQGRVFLWFVGLA